MDEVRPLLDSKLFCSRDHILFTFYSFHDVWYEALKKVQVEEADSTTVSLGLFRELNFESFNPRFEF